MDTALAAAAVLVAQVVKGMTGFGSALVAVPLLTLLYGPTQAIFLVVCTDVVTGSMLVFQARRDVRWRLVLSMLAPAIFGQYVGTGLLVRLPTSTAKVVIAAVVAVFALDMAARPIKEGRGELEALPAGRPGLLLGAAGAGLLGGTMAGLVGAGGPPVVIFLRRHFRDGFARAQMMALFLPSACVLALMLSARGAVDVDGAWRLFALVPAALLGGITGSGLSTRVPRAAFGRVVGALLLGAAATLLATNS